MQITIRMIVAAFITALFLSGCDTIRPYTDRAVEERKAMNDSQAELAVLGMCDVALGAAVRVWSREELELAFLVCNPQRQEVNMSRLVAPGAGL